MNASQRIEIDGLAVGFQVAGDPAAASLLLLHGFPMDRRLWSKAIAPLAETFHTYAVDLPGFGESALLGETQSMETLANWVARFIDVAEVPEPVALCGLSMGGYIALEFAARHGHRLSRLILCDTKSDRDTDDARAARLQLADSVATTGLEPVAETMLPRLLAPATFENCPEVVAELRQMILGCDPRAVAAVSRGMAGRRDTGEVVSSLEVPLLAIVGESDALTPPELMQQLAERAPQGRLVTIPAAGHVCPLEQPRDLAAAITAG